MGLSWRPPASADIRLGWVASGLRGLHDGPPAVRPAMTGVTALAEPRDFALSLRQPVPPAFHASTIHCVIAKRFLPFVIVGLGACQSASRPAPGVTMAP